MNARSMARGMMERLRLALRQFPVGSRRIRRLVVGVIVVVGTPAAWLLAHEAGGGGAVLVARVKRGAFTVTVTTSGELKAQQSVKITGPSNMQQVEIHQTKIASLGPASHMVAPRVESVTFLNGDVMLAGTLYLPNQGTRAAAIVAYHDASGPLRSFPAYQHLATVLPDIGVAVLLFDRRGSGESGGSFSSASFQDLASDGLQAVAYLKTRGDIDPSRIGVWGLSQGGWIAPLAASLSPDVAFVVAVSASGVSPAAQMDFAAASALRLSGQPRTVVDRVLHIRSEVNAYYRGHGDRASVQSAVDSIRVASWFAQAFLPNGGKLPSEPRHTKWYLEMDYDPLPVLSRILVPMAFFFADSDRWVPVDESIKTTRDATKTNPNVFIDRVAGADHRMETGVPDSGGPTSPEYVKSLEAWLRRTLDL